MSTTASVGREKRKTAGRRMNALVGEALEQDDAFWGHDTWNDEGEDSGNDSFRESDEDSELRKDVFDSDFDDSETDNEDEEAAAGEAEERELRQSERDASNKQRSRGKYVDSKSKKGRGAKLAGMRRVVGEGFNKGIVLNFPPSAAQLASAAHQHQQQQQQPVSTSVPSTAITSTSQATETTPKKPPPPAAAAVAQAPVPAVPPATRTRSSRSSVQSGSSRGRRSTNGSRKLRDFRSTPGETKTTTSSTKQTSKKSAAASTAAAASRAAKRRRYGQEELLLEAVHQTEPENKRWLHGRKRIQDQHEKDLNASNAALRDRTRGKVVEKFHSRRGALTTLTFPEMDAVPEILTRKATSRTKNDAITKASIDDGTTPPPTSSRSKAKIVCVITGKPARYKDPLTKLPYYDLKAFKELRRRHEMKDHTLGTETETKPTSISTTSTNTGPAVEGQADSNKSDSAPNGKQKKPQAAHTPTSRPSSSNGKKPDGAKRKSKPKLKKSISSSKLPFQSPKPPKPAPSTDISGGTNEKNPDGTTAQVQENISKAATATKSIAASGTTGSINRLEASAALSAQKSPVVEKLAFSWGDTPSGPTSNDDNGSPLSPTSGRRLSRRKWKPSEKIIDAIATSPSKDGIITTPAGMKIKTQPVIGANEIATMSVPSLAPDATIQSTLNHVDSLQNEPSPAVASTSVAAIAGGEATNGTSSNHSTKKDESTTNSQSNESSVQTQHHQQPQQSGTETSSTALAPNPDVSVSNMDDAEKKQQPQPYHYHQQQQDKSQQVDQEAAQGEHTKETKTIEANGSPEPPPPPPPSQSLTDTGPKVTSEDTST